MKKCIKILLVIILIGITTILSINYYIIHSTKPSIINPTQIETLPEIDCILVLGAGIKNNQPSLMLKDRLTKSIELYNIGLSKKILMSGDHQNDNYNEVAVMKEFAIEQNIPSEDIFMDHEGYSTYESIHRAKNIFGVNKMIIVTQEYHLYRALYIAKQLGIEAYGIASDKKQYTGQTYRDIREVLARNKDFLYLLFTKEKKNIQPTIPINGNGDKTNKKGQI